MGPGAFLSHESAAALWGLAGDRPKVHVNAPRGRQVRPGRRSGIKVHRCKFAPTRSPSTTEFPSLPSPERSSTLPNDVPSGVTEGDGRPVLAQQSSCPARTQTRRRGSATSSGRERRRARRGPAREGERRPTGRPYSARSISTAIAAVSVGLSPTRTPFASSASFLPWAVPEEPEMIAPAWPICLPGGAVKPAM